MTTYQKIFNVHFMEMCKDIELLFHDDYQVSKVVTYFDIIIKSKPKSVFQYCKTYFKIYDSKIKEDALLFFLEHEYENELKESNYSHIREPIETFKKKMMNISEENKNKIREYLDNLINIASLDTVR